MSKLCVIAIMVLLSGCSSTTGIQKVNASKSQFDKALIYKGVTTVINDEIPDDEAYRVFHQGASSFVPVSAIRESAEIRANNFCKEKGKIVEVLRERRSRGAHIFGNFPRIEIIFTCIDHEDAETVSADDQNKINKLREWKALLDEGAITTDEYQIEKEKILKA